jgi:DNA repair exonuclease SbcCD ATPase subunit
MARKSSSAVSYSSDEENMLIFDEDGDYTGASAAPMEDMQTQVKVAQEELLQLRMRQEEIERQQEHLESIRKKQAAFATGKRELLDKLNRNASSIERELYNAQKLTEELSATHDVFSRHLDVLRSLQPEKWQRNAPEEELDRAIEAIEDAEADFTKSVRRLENLRSVEPSQPSHSFAMADAGSDDLKLWFKRGLAFTLPLMLTLALCVVIARLLF